MIRNILASFGAIRSTILVGFVFVIPITFPPIASAPPIPDEIKKAVTFVFAPTTQGLKAIGTGFFVSVPNETDPTKMFGYTVTAKHVLQVDPDDPKKGLHPMIFLRVGNPAGDADLLPIFLTGPKATQVFTHGDHSVDIAVIAGAPRGKYDLKFIGSSMLATREHLSQGQIKEGDETFFLGLFSPFPGMKKNYPIVRFGRLALVTEEKIPWKGEMLTLYLMETQSFGGNSGAPVFFYPGLERKPGTVVLGGPTLLLAGVMKGTFRDLNQILFAEPGKEPKAEMLEGKIPISVENMGIAPVVPAFQLHEILFSDEAKALRASER
jgi:hypothetical protein